MKTYRWGISACVAALALALAGGIANAQQKAPDAPAKADAKKADAPKADAKKAEPPKGDAKKAEPAKKAEVKKAEPAKKVVSACAGIEEPACLGNNECMWVKEVVRKTGVKQKAHCQKKPTPPAAKKAEPAKKDAAAAAKAPGAAAPAAKAPTAAAPAPAAPAPAKK